MNKYQEAFDKLASIDLQVYGEDKFGDGRLTPLYACECYPDEFKVVQELIDKQEKYRWHDLRKDPNDLPNESLGCLVCMSKNGYSPHWFASYNKERECWLDGIDWGRKLDKVIAWKYIEHFEDE